MSKFRIFGDNPEPNWYEDVDLEALPRKYIPQSFSFFDEPEAEDYRGQVIKNVIQIGKLIKEVYDDKLDIEDEGREVLNENFEPLLGLLNDVYELLNYVDIPFDEFIKRLCEEGIIILNEADSGMRFREELKSIFLEMKRIKNEKKRVVNHDPEFKKIDSNMINEHIQLKNSIYEQKVRESKDDKRVEVEDYTVNVLMIENNLQEILELIKESPVKGSMLREKIFRHISLVMSLLYNAISGQSGIYFESTSDGEGGVFDFLGEVKIEKIKNLSTLTIQTLHGLKKVRELKELLTGKRNII